MFKPSVTIHKAPDGAIKVLECSEDATPCLKAYLDCDEPGELVYIRKGFKDKQKKVIPGTGEDKPKRGRPKKSE